MSTSRTGSGAAGGASTVPAGGVASSQSQSSSAPPGVAPVAPPLPGSSVEEQKRHAENRQYMDKAYQAKVYHLGQATPTKWVRYDDGSDPNDDAAFSGARLSRGQNSGGDLKSGRYKEVPGGEIDVYVDQKGKVKPVWSKVDPEDTWHGMGKFHSFRAGQRKALGLLAAQGETSVVLDWDDPKLCTAKYLKQFMEVAREKNLKIEFGPGVQQYLATCSKANRERFDFLQKDINRLVDEHYQNKNKGANSTAEEAALRRAALVASRQDVLKEGYKDPKAVDRKDAADVGKEVKAVGTVTDRAEFIMKQMAQQAKQLQELLDTNPDQVNNPQQEFDNVFGCAIQLNNLVNNLRARQNELGANSFGSPEEQQAWRALVALQNKTLAPADKQTEMDGIKQALPDDKKGGFDQMAKLAEEFVKNEKRLVDVEGQKTALDAAGKKLYEKAEEVADSRIEPDVDNSTRLT